MSASTSQVNTVKPPQVIGCYPDSASKILSYEAQKLQQCQQPLYPGSFTYARCCGKDPGWSWSHEPPDFRGNSN